MSSDLIPNPRSFSKFDLENYRFGLALVDPEVEGELLLRAAFTGEATREEPLILQPITAKQYYKLKTYAVEKDIWYDGVVNVPDTDRVYMLCMTRKGSPILNNQGKETYPIKTTWGYIDLSTHPLIIDKKELALHSIKKLWDSIENNKTQIGIIISILGILIAYLQIGAS